jgi:BirA family biotin operon repressor/biotin-[acetyl-CoA-carboxylase] ligase
LEKIGVSARLKWPNDVYVNGRKLGGVLIQTIARPATTVLVGLGLNLNRSDRFGPDAISLNEILTTPPERVTLAEPICDAIAAQINRLEASPDSVVHDWTARALWIGQHVGILAPEVVSGQLRGIDSFGRALIETQSGTVAVASGDLKRGPRPIAPPYTC